MTESAIVHAEIDSPIGPIHLFANEKGLTGLYMNTHRDALPPAAMLSADQNLFLSSAAKELGEYFEGKRKDFSVTLDPHGTQFQMRVWTELLNIPFGQTISYGELAKRLGDPLLTRAVGTANGQNPISIIIPCHRVIGANGHLTGYGGGIEKKRWLLDHEAEDTLF
ncbi:MAG: methylated-DNA--[protein]-cysteine S-methyltransferase [Armatimonadetes bacterium]|nr:methylated-DNA--[protein]-cysteine S-methyltransferase [Armatimonadota bacterium]MBS1726781.1 methylated-DNA--[protein]-cysteine S-methyltransferase [Armatimonadota bacterium]